MAVGASQTTPGAVVSFPSVRQYPMLVEPILPPVPPIQYLALSEPIVKRKRGLPVSDMPFFAAPPAVVVPFSWFEELSKPPTLKKRGLAPHMQQAFTFDLRPRVSFGWFGALSEPVRQKPGLKASRQQFLATPSRLLPTPTLFGVLNALETKDTMVAGALVWNRITDTEIGVVNTTPQPAEISLSPAAPSVGQVFCKISVRIG